MLRVKGLYPGVISSDFVSRLTVTDVSTTSALVIFRVKVSCITSVDDKTLVIDLIVQLSRDVIGRLSVNT